MEGSAKCIPEKLLLEAINYAHQSIQDVLEAQNELKARIGKAKLEVPPVAENPQITEKVKSAAAEPMRAALAKPGKQNRNNALAEVMASVAEDLAAQYEDSEAIIAAALENLEKEIIRNKIIQEKLRIDGRTPTDIRPISCDVAVLPRTHGSGLFTRGETQALVTTTLGTAQDEQRIDSLIGESTKSFMLHYNFPPF